MTTTQQAHAERQDRYLEAAAQAITSHDPAVTPYLTTTCPECGWEDSANHGRVRDYITLGCEGYWVISPNVLGISMLLWQDWTEA